MKYSVHLTRLFLVGILMVLVGAVPAVDSQLDAKRKAGAQSLRAGNAQEALVFLSEVAASPEATYQDQLALGRVLDKLGRGAEGARPYRRVLEMTSETAKDADERSARTEAERRLKTLDPMWDRVRQASDRFLKELEALDRDAERAHNDLAQEQIFRLRLALVKADPNANVTAFTVLPNPANWQETGFKVVAGQVYRCRARGVWRMGKTSADDCNANGLADRRNSFGPIGMLQAAVEQKPPFINLGVDVEFKAPSTGILGLGRNQEAAAGVSNSGCLWVLIEKK
jgi:hypothetical protein